jgi:cyclin-dependent kinase-like
MHKFRVEEVIGEGAYGVVLKCRVRESGLVVAIKKFKESEEVAKVRKTTLREVRLLRLLSAGENIVTLQEAFHRGGKLYLVFEHVDRSLLQLLQETPRGQGCPVWQVRLYVYQLLKAIAWCHTHGVYHRDIKPENVLVNDDHSLRLCDFGFACAVPAGREAPPLTQYVATRWYRAPELLLGCPSYSERVDEWAVGCIFAELAAGRPAFPGESHVDSLHLIQTALGPLTPLQLQQFYANPAFGGLKFADMSRPAGLHVLYGTVLPLAAVLCLSSLLRLEPAARADAASVLHHPWFDGVIDPSAPGNPAVSTAEREVVVPSGRPARRQCPPSAPPSGRAPQQHRPPPLPPRSAQRHHPHAPGGRTVGRHYHHHHHHAPPTIGLRSRMSWPAPKAALPRAREPLGAAQSLNAKVGRMRLPITQHVAC